MAYIYKIVNDINDKLYIGKTYDSIEQRFKQHCWDSQKEKTKNRPLYSAMKKYGINHFHIKLIEETNNPEEREKYWIKYYDSYKNGYNATLGGDGKSYIDYEKIYDLYKQGKNLVEITKILKCDEHTCKIALDQYNISHEDRVKQGRRYSYHPVLQLDKNTEEVIQEFSSIRQAYDALDKEHSGKIAAVCKGKAKTAYGYKWKYKEF